MWVEKHKGLSQLKSLQFETSKWIFGSEMVAATVIVIGRTRRSAPETTDCSRSTTVSVLPAASAWGQDVEIELEQFGLDGSWRPGEVTPVLVGVSLAGRPDPDAEAFLADAV